MQVRLRTYGSVAVADAYRDFADALWSFFAYVPSVRAIKERGTDAGDTVRVHEEFEEARLRVREALRSLERLVSDELAAL